MAKNNAPKKAGKSFLSMFTRLFVPNKPERNVLEEEAIRTPAKTIFLNLISNKLAVLGFIGFVLILMFSFVGSKIFPMEPTYTELTNSNLRPGRNYLKYPKELQNKNIVKIVSGISFSVALDDEGKLHIWGTESNRELRNVSDYIMNIPDEIQKAKIVDIEAGGTHVIAIDEDDNFYGWGYYGNNQTKMPMNIDMVFSGADVRIVRMAAATQWTALLGSDGNMYIWGSTSARTTFLIPSDVEGRVVDFVAGDNNMALLLDDGTMRIIGQDGTEFARNIPTELRNGELEIVGLTATNRNVLALDANGDLHLWGSSESGLNRLPEIVGDVEYIDAGYKNFVAVTTDGRVYVWGADDLGQLNLPSKLDKTEKVYADYFQFYAVGENSKIVGAWGNKGYFFGSDQYGRDMLTRLIHGGRISLTVGAIAMVISTIIAIIIGLVSGYFGGWVDQGLMRLTDIFSSIPFFPIAVTLSYAIGNQISQTNRMYMIMVILGVLGWMGLARLIRAQLLLEREKDFVLAARSLGIKQRNIMLRHILPNVFNLVIVNITLGYASSLLTEAGLSFLGFGVTEPTPSWGNMLTSAQESSVIQFYWWRWVIPAIFVVATALCVNLIGDALREAMDPKSNER